MKWENLPDFMQTEEVEEYYNILKQKRGSLVAKRVFDIVMSLILLVVLSPFMLIIAIAVKGSSPGEVIFRQTRVTTYGKRFQIYKFRTMVSDAPQKGSQVTVSGDSMEPTIPDGAKILARKIEEGLWESASGVVSIVYGKTLSVKRILKNSLFLDNVLTLKADNPKHGQLDVERREIRGMWQALRIISQKII